MPETIPSVGAAVPWPWPPPETAVPSRPPCADQMPQRDLYPIPEVAHRCARSNSWVHKQIAAGHLAAVKLGRAFRVRRTDLDTFLSQLEEA